MAIELENDTESMDLTDIKGIGDQMATALKRAGYESVADLTDADADKLVTLNISRLGKKTADKIIDQAQTLYEAGEEVVEDLLVTVMFTVRTNKGDHEEIFNDWNNAEEFYHNNQP